ncbi:60S ribosomal protein L9, putative [Leishmania tarentolae]|uniref:60S ribosomal protein L9, putative n=1 Tax=Leishmania tarentolae TaxID=5689 RepID=A0A640KTT8_LEITA|nr:60S ribosomal protein L9, putative [Leishmania tarentolae]
MFCTCALVVFRHAIGILEPNQRITVKVRFFLSTRMSSCRCVRSFVRVPRLPVTVTLRPFTSTVTPSGICRVHRLLTLTIFLLEMQVGFFLACACVRVCVCVCVCV